MKDQRTVKSIEHLAYIENVVEFVYASEELSELFYLPWTLPRESTRKGFMTVQ